jgi:hypothetical protein
MGLTEPLIRKRQGCHAWEPEKFTKDDPRHGWTWDHCQQDAVALLGSEEAVKDYIEGKADQPGDTLGPPKPERSGKRQRKDAAMQSQGELFKDLG